MTFNFKRYFVLFCLGLSVLLNIFLWVYLAIKVPVLGEEVVLHYDAIQGVDLIGPGNHFYVLPLIGLVIIGINFLLAAFSIKTNRLVAQVLSGLAVVGQVILVVAAMLMVNINI